MNELTVVEQTDLEQHEATIKHGLQTFVEVGTALLAIRDGRLYRVRFGTFEDYCKERWGMDRRYANYQIAAAQVIGNLGTIVPVLPATESQARPLSKLSPEDQPIVWQRAVETAPNGKVTAAHIETTVKNYVSAIAPLPVADTYEKLADDLASDEAGYDWTEEPVRVQPDETLQIAPVDETPKSDSDEYYTPAYIIDAARAVLGEIDLDPASCERAQMVVCAATYYSKADNGLSKVWRGRIWLNPPFSKPEAFVMKAIDEYESGNIKSAILLTNNSTDTQWGQALLSRYPVCFVGANNGRRSRISFWKETPDKPDPSNRYSQMIFFLGKDSQKFLDVFSQFGPILEKK